MTDTLIPSISGLVILGLFWTLVVRKSRLSLAGGILLTVLPVIAGNLYWFYACKPELDVQKQEQRALAQISSLPGYRVLKIQEPGLWRMLQQAFCGRFARVTVFLSPWDSCAVCWWMSSISVSAGPVMMR